MKNASLGGVRRLKKSLFNRHYNTQKAGDAHERGKAISAPRKSFK